jgi:hypothetical protein
MTRPDHVSHLTTRNYTTIHQGKNRKISKFCKTNLRFKLYQCNREISNKLDKCVDGMIARDNNKVTIKQQDACGALNKDPN